MKTKSIALSLLIVLSLMTFSCKKSSSDDINNTVPVMPTGAINGLFSINENVQVYFSKGNLQYKASTHTWRFAEKQWNIVGSDNENISSTYDGWIDLFGYGTGDFPTYNSDNDYNYSNYAEWGDNAISNGGSQTNMWRTLTNNEWKYILNIRDTKTGKRYAKAEVNGVNGLILLPDNWSTSTYSLNSYNTTDAAFTANVITESDWSTLENKGAVFLPATGTRNQTTYYSYDYEVGAYWTSTLFNDHQANILHFSSSSLQTDSFSNNRLGHAVRLVSR